MQYQFPHGSLYTTRRAYPEQLTDVHVWGVGTLIRMTSPGMEFQVNNFLCSGEIIHGRVTKKRFPFGKRMAHEKRVFKKLCSIYFKGISEN